MGLSRHERRTERRVQWRHVPPSPTHSMLTPGDRFACLCRCPLNIAWRGKRGQVVVIYDVFHSLCDFPNESWVSWGSVADPQITNFHFSPLRVEGIRPSFTDFSYFASQYPRPCHRDTHWKTCVFLEWSLKDALKDPLKDVRNLNTLYERRRLVYEPENIYNLFYH